MSTIKNIIYLDYEKMYSLSAQLFKGVVFESIIEKGYSFSDKDSNNKKNENIALDSDSRTNYIKPYDYHYSMFEQKLEELGKITTLNSGEFSDEISLDKIKLAPFIKSVGQILITDPVALHKITKEYKLLSEKLGYITGSGRINEIYEEMKLLPRDNKALLTNLGKEIKRIEEQLKYDSGLINERYHDYLADIIKFSFGDEIEINQKLGNYLVTAFMERAFFKLSIPILLKRYARKTVCDFTMLGILTQYEKESWMLPEVGFPDFRNAAKNLINANYEVEMTFLAPGKSEIMIEPISMYTEL
ncbi:TPA: hypothetical protein PXN54_000201 [Yersinia enterocolitica]|nr:hypothetical protein [Yersinia enterocolitica]